MTTLLFLLAAAISLRVTRNLGGSEFDENVSAINAALEWWAEEADFASLAFMWGDEEVLWPRWFLRGFYTLKAILCVLLGWRNWLDYGETVDVGAWNIRPYHGEYDGNQWTELRVGEGFFTRWSYHHMENSSV